MKQGKKIIAIPAAILTAISIVPMIGQVTYAEGAVNTVTFKGNGHGPENIYTLDVAEGETIWDAINNMEGGQQAFWSKVDIGVIEGDNEYSIDFYCHDDGCIDPLYYEEDFKEVITEDKIYYAKWNTCVKEVNIEVMRPVCGTKVDTEWNGQYRDFTIQKESPQVTVASGNCELLIAGYMGGFEPTGEPKALNGVTMTGGNKYGLFVDVETPQGYSFAREVNVTINGAEYMGKSVSDNWMKIYAEVTPVHAEAAPVEENAVAPTCTEDGSHDDVVYCTNCGEEVSRNTVTDKATGHDWGEWVTIKEATETEEGDRIRTCKNDSSHTETETIPAKGKEVVQEKKEDASEKGGGSSSKKNTTGGSSSGESPDTGDNNLSVLWQTLLCTSASAIAVVIVYLKRKQYK